MSSLTIDAAVATPARLGECPLWDPVAEALYWTDIEGRVLHRYDPAIGLDTTRGMPGRVGSFVRTSTPDEFVLAMEHRLVRHRLTDPGRFEPVIDLLPAVPGNRLNDGRTDPAGRFVVGTMHEDPTAGRATGSLHQIGPDGSRVLRTGVGIPNALAFDPARGRVYWADTPTRQVVVADYDPDRGAWEHERLFFDYAGLPGLPDGACVDAEGGYWSASVMGWAVIRVSPEGTVDERIELPLEKPSMPAFGGPDLATMYVTTIGAEGGRPCAPGHDGFVPGSLLAIEGIGVTGVVDPVFGG